MLLRSTICLAAAMLISLPAMAIAGGPPWLTLPIASPVAGGVEASTARLAAELGLPAGEGGFALHQDGKQWYLTIDLEEDATLGQIERACEASGLAVAIDSLHLFGHAIVEIDPQGANHSELLAALDAMEEVDVSEPALEGGLLRVTVDMPYPVFDRQRGQARTQCGWDTFALNDFSTSRAGSRDPIPAGLLPSYNDFRRVVGEQGGRLEDIRFDNQFACRPLGGVAAQDDPSAAATAAGGR
jgi:hypothetical protein